MGQSLRIFLKMLFMAYLVFHEKAATERNLLQKEVGMS
ncbi:unnamed protein product [Gulo gulo]|uniref:Uncharacterized protein n=1 Tax=Gulo gulo TaxID=48420 RepID=A0A9X9LW85_GULGU|nr:unnamed protein product [Gulo gulo]